MPEKKQKFGFQLPQSFAEAFNSYLCEGRVTGKEKWVVISAAILALLEMPEDEQNEYIGRVKSADTPKGSFAAMVKGAAKVRETLSVIKRTDMANEEADAASKSRASAGGGAGRLKTQAQ